MYKIQTLNKISSKGLNHFPLDNYEVASDINNPDAILVRSQDMHGMELSESVKAIARAGAGTNNIPIAELSEKGVVVFNTPGANANGVKEMVLAGLLLALKGDFPTKNEALVCGRCRFLVLEIRKHRIISVRVKVMNEIQSDATNTTENN